MTYPWEKKSELELRAERRKEYYRAWYAVNREKQLFEFKKYHEENKEAILERKKKFYQIYIYFFTIILIINKLLLTFTL